MSATIKAAIEIAAFVCCLVWNLWFTIKLLWLAFSGNKCDNSSGNAGKSNKNVNDDSPIDFYFFLTAFCSVSTVGVLVCFSHCGSGDSTLTASSDKLRR